MTIKEIEERSGLTRANIRFYESEGLLTPQRLPNGYRDYSEHDLTCLRRIRLLRALGLSLDELRALCSGREPLTEALERRLDALVREHIGLERCAEVCRRLCQDRAGWDTLDALPYLDILDAPLPESDAVKPLQVPFRRFFARLLDFALCNALWSAFLLLALNLNISSLDSSFWLLNWCAVLFLLLLLEPAALHFFGTTPGKAVLGLHVSDPEGGRLSWYAALERTLNAQAYGAGMNIPILRLWRLWKSFDACISERGLLWENESTLTLRDTRPRRIAVYVFSWLLIFGFALLCVQTAEVPLHRGPLTVAEFSENFNRLADYHQLAADLRLDSDGSWVPHNSNSISLSIAGGAPPELHYTQHNGQMTGLSIDMDVSGTDLWAPFPGYELDICILSFVRAQNGLFALGDRTVELLRLMDENAFEAVSVSVNGVNITRTAEHSGYLDIGGVLVPAEGEAQHFIYHFSMELE